MPKGTPNKKESLFSDINHAIKAMGLAADYFGDGSPEHLAAIKVRDAVIKAWRGCK